jgi:hypothetical protein
VRLPGPRWCAFCPKCRCFVGEPCRNKLDLPVGHCCVFGRAESRTILMPVRMVPRASPLSERESVARYFEALARVEIGMIDFGLPARELYAMVASWVRNRLDERWAAEVSARAHGERGPR